MSRFVNLGLRLFIGIAVIYLLSIGPSCRIAARNSHTLQFIAKLYSPLVWQAVSDTFPVGTFIQWYVVKCSGDEMICEKLAAILIVEKIEQSSDPDVRRFYHLEPRKAQEE